MNRGSIFFNYHRDDFLIIYLKSLEEQRQPLANFVNPHRHDRDRADMAADPGDPERRLCREYSAEPIEVAAHPCGIKFLQQRVDLGPSCQGLLAIGHLPGSKVETSSQR